jgi:hypothetical protein
MSPTYRISVSSPSIDLQERQQMPPKIQFSVWRTFKHHIPRFVTTIAVDVILPLVIYIFLQQKIKPVYALLAASSPPLFMVIFKAIWLCTFDALGFLVFFSFVITAVVAVVSRNPIILLLEKSLITGVLSLIFGMTLVPFKCCKNRCRWRPLAYYFYQDLVPTKRKEIGLPDDIFDDKDEQIADNYAQLKEEISIEKLNHKQEVAQVYEWLYGHIILSTITVLMILFTIICITIERRFTLAFIERWTEQHLNVKQSQERRSSEMTSSVMIVNCDSNCVLSVDA